MKYLRKAIRKIKYNLRFINKSEKTKLNYVVNSSSNTKLTELMNLYGSDKGGKNNHHNYSEFYSEIFFHKRKEIKTLLEIGIGTNNTNLDSNMGNEGVPSASLRAWRDYFENATIYGADIDKNIVKNEERIKTFYVDQTNSTTIFNMFKDIGENKFDIIIDDGLHEFSANICLFENSVKKLSENGTYIIEDIFYKDKIKFLNYFENQSYNFSIVDIYHKKNIANNCLIIIKNDN